MALRTTGATAGPGGRQLCFDPSRLSEPDLDVATFVADIRTRAPLAIIHGDLQAHVGSVSQELIQQIQADFNKFVAIGPSIGEADGLIEDVSTPLSKVQDELVDLRAALAGDIQALDAALMARRQLADRKSALQLLLRISELVTKCERLLKEMEDLAEESLARWRSIERLCTDWSQLSFALVRSPPSSKFIVNLSLRVQRIKEDLSHHLATWFNRVLDGSRQGDPTVQAVLVAFAVASMVDAAQEIYRQKIVVPFAGAHVRMAAASVTADGRSVASPAESFETVVDNITEFLNESCAPVINLCHKEETLNVFDVLTYCVWPELEKAIVSRMAPIFSPGIADVFHRCFSAALRLFGALEKHCLSPERSQNLRESQATADFWRKWNLPVYFQLRFQEISTPLGEILEHEPEFAPKEAGQEGESSNYQLLSSDVYQLTATRTMTQAIRRCWDNEVFLQPLTHRFLRLTIQLIARYATWVDEGIGEKFPANKGLMNGAVAVYGDLELIRSRLPAELASLLRIRASTIPSRVLSAIDSAIAEAMTNIGGLLEPLQLSIQEKLSVSCVEGLQHVRGILATYRGMASRPPPTQHSRFVPNILRPLRTFSNEASSRMSKSVKTEICRFVIERTAQRYCEMATEILSNAKQQEDTLKRLNIGRGNNGASTSSDSDKISLQLYLDASKFASEIDSFGVESGSVVSFISLYDMVAESSGVSAAKKVDASPRGTSTEGPSISPPKAESSAVAPLIDESSAALPACNAIEGGTSTDAGVP